ncbi:hypothetical protein Zm00014a_017300 [Zea mays]|uniref:Uncharacterized protein n=1 Tax=Zea mays TaxID=4577 RepID=A0A3L6GE24_MAIZE|nr:hypothetical protein Zm00014a_017300 [Zea mays]
MTSGTRGETRRGKGGRTVKSARRAAAAAAALMLMLVQGLMSRIPVRRGRVGSKQKCRTAKERAHITISMILRVSQCLGPVFHGLTRLCGLVIFRLISNNSNFLVARTLCSSAVRACGLPFFLQFLRRRRAWRCARCPDLHHLSRRRRASPGS